MPCSPPLQLPLAYQGGWLLAPLALLRASLAAAHDFCRSREKRPTPAKHNGSLDHVHVAFSTDASNFAGLLTAMISLVRHLASPGRCSLHLLVPADDLPAARRLAGCLRRELRALPELPTVAPRALRPLPFPLTFYRLPLAIYWTRIFLQEYLPAAPRVIWLDHDVVVRADLAELYAMRMEHALAGAPEFVPPHFVRPMTYRDHIRECPHVARYAGPIMDSATFNTGVLLLDLDKWRSGEVTRSVTEWAVLTNGCFLDQLALNLAFSARADRLDWRWNWRPNASLPTTAECLSEVRIFHWNTYPNPKYWMSCRSRSPMADEGVWKLHQAQQDCDAIDREASCE